ncbi:beta strand repeat-containing protein [Pseudomonas azerbaijanorientalis]|uniref:beta strand repeat-containing protein n=1 Tax=Pseudomonas azerbaijanorientalis TaxID=2842350 RepID=UPI001C3E6C82|nr:nidogen-like domain-containing protein [Pseudomonas azerbaijanorientalis]QXH62306.1 M10 family metallopeptidase C-terminal domain-containing protein [Pseudomonas azerbaijanorientalis]
MASLINGLGGAAGFGENQLTRNDDSYTSYIDISTVFGAAGLNFFGTNYTDISVNNNGNITFGGGLSTYTPYGMQDSSRPMIAPFFADVDTRGGTVSATPGGTSTGSNLVYYDFNSAGNGTLTVTWDDVGYYNSKVDKLNAFQLQLVGKGNGNFDVIFRYETVNWTTGSASGGTDGLGGTVARAGYSTGDSSSWYELPQSGNESAILGLETTPGNTGVAGYYKFSIVSGTSGNDNMQGTAGNDSLYGSAGNDVINGYAGNDVLYGAAGSDRLLGGLGDDTYIVDALDTLVELANQGIDVVQSEISYTLGDNLENLILTGNSSINGTGNALNNTFVGNSFNNVFNGAAGTDFVSYAYSNYGVSVDLSNTGSQYTSQGYDTFVSIEGVIGTDDSDTLTGNALANILYGGADNDTLNGGGGNDSLDGGSGADQMTGGDGSDVYYVDNVGDIVSETNAVASTGGTDSVYSYLGTYTLGNNVENLRLLSTGAANGTGNSLNNVIDAGAGNNILNGGAGIDTASYAYATAAVTANLALTTAQATGGSGSDTLLNFENLTGSNYHDKLTGNALANTLSGGLGSDQLNGAAGADRMIGGDGADLYYVDNAGDIVSETNAVASTGGIDTVYSLISAYTLTDNVENLRLLATGVANGTGNSLNNVIDAGAGNNVLNGGAGIDTASYAYATAAVTANLGLTTAQATGGSGSDTLLNFENLTGSNYHDKLTGNALANTLSGGLGSDQLNGAAGADRMIGGDGADLYYVDNAGDIVSETNAVASTGGIDTVYSLISAYTLTDNVENLRLLSTGAANGTGNSLNNVINAGTGNNVLNGGTGVDTASYLYAGSAITASLAVTTAQATGGSGADTLLAIENLTGSNYNDRLTGNTAANLLNGGGGNDILVGGMGKDVLTGGIGNDIFDFNALTETGLTSSTWDIITDFTRGADKIDLSTLDANAATTTNEAFHSVIGSTAAFSAAGQLKVSAGVLYGNTDADSAAEFAIQIVGISNVTTADFIL